VRAAILSETATSTDDPCSSVPTTTRCICSAIPPDYEQPLENALGAQARRQGRQPEELAYEAMLANEGRGMLYVPFLNYADGNLDAVREMLRDPHSVPGLSDGGAHCGIICDASFPTYLLTHWTRDRSRGEKLPIPRSWGRGSASRARRRCRWTWRSRRPRAGATRRTSTSSTTAGCTCTRRKCITTFRSRGRRLLQQIDGYDATIVSGVVTQRHGAATGGAPRPPGARLRGMIPGRFVAAAE